MSLCVNFLKTNKMKYYSTNRLAPLATLEEAVVKGLAGDKGLYMPEKIKALPSSFFEKMKDMSFQEISYVVADAFFGEDVDADTLKQIVYDTLPFDAPVVHVNNSIYSLELYHGPTLAFKDVGGRFMARLLGHFIRKQGKKEVNVLVATSGDTGKAALAGFSDVPGTKIIVFYPKNGVSPIQEKQMVTQKGDNTYVIGIKGNFDDAQTGVKKIFTTPSVAEKLAENNMLFSSANSINWGRLLPQIVYYISAYCDLVNDGKIELGDKINVVVPTGNFGNILASYYASLMGLPINKFICASNSNNVLTDFIKTGVYDKNRNFYTTISPSMDILVSSNLERLLYKLSGDNDEVTRGWMNALKSEGKYEVSDDVKAVINEKFYGGFCDDKNTEATIHEMFEQDKYLCDTHTAVAINVYKQYVEETGDKTPSVIASTASPYKFSKAVLEAVEPNATLPETEFDMVDELHKVSGAEVPAPLANLKNKTARFSDVTEVSDMENYVLGALGID